MDGCPKAKRIKQDIEEDDEREASHSVGASTVKSATNLERCSSSQTNVGLPPSIIDELLSIEQRQCSQLLEIEYPSPVTHVYNPLSYASQTHQNFVRRYGSGRKKVLFVGMNPGPFGMAQNGVPFGDTTMVKEWLGIAGVVNSPTNEHPKRTIQGLDCTKNEVSGTRFWNLMRELCSNPEVFFKNCYVHNYCPLCFMAASGKNVTPPMLRTLERRHLEEICNQSLVEIISLLGVEFVIGVGKYAEERARAALVAAASEAVQTQDGTKDPLVFNQTETPPTNSTQEESIKKEERCVSDNSTTPVQSAACDTGLGSERLAERCRTRLGSLKSVKVYGLMHPSPINPAANKGWNQLATTKFSELGLLEIIKGSK